MFDQILDLVGQPPGSLVYHFIILFAIEAAFAISVGQWMRERDNSTLRLVIAVFVLFCGRVLVLIASLAAWQGYLPRNVLLPPVERLVDTVTVLALMWAFITMDDPEILRRNFMPDVTHAVLLGMALVGFGGTYYFWSAGTSRELLFNGLWVDTAWSVAQIGLVIAGLIWMMSRGRYLYDPFIKGIMLLLLAAAAGLHIMRPVLGDVAAAMRAAHLIVIPMLTAVAYRHVVEHLLHWDTFEPSRLSMPPAGVDQKEADSAVAARQPGGEVEAERKAAPVYTPPPPESLAETIAHEGEPEVDEEPETAEEAADAYTGPELLEVIDAIGGLLATLEPSEIVDEVPRAVATALRADVCVLAIVDEAVVNAGLVGGYDNIAQAPLRTDVLDLADHPTIVNALGRLRQMRLTPQRNARELRDLYSKLNIMHEGPAYIQPLVNGEERIGVLVVASPYSGRQFSNLERNLLDRLAPLVTAALLNSEHYKDAAEAIGVGELYAERTEPAMLSDELMAKQAELDAAQRQIEEMKAYIRDVHRRLEELPQQQEVAQEQIESLATEADRLRKKAAEAEELREEVERLERLVQRSEDLEEEVLALRRHSKEQRENAISEREVQRRVEAAQEEVLDEVASLRVRLREASISRQEVAFLQEQLAVKARESIELETRLTEAKAVADALREQVASGMGSTRKFETLQARVAQQANEIAHLKSELAEAEAAIELSPDAKRAGEEMDQIDRDAMAQLEAQLAERAALIEALENQLNEKARAMVELKSHMSEVNNSLRSLEEQLTHKTEEVTDLQESLTRTREQAQERIAALEDAIEDGSGDASEVDQVRVEALEAELAEKATAVETLEAQLDNTRQSMIALESQLSSTNRAVDAAITNAGQIDTHDEVISSIAQELRTPMSSIMGYTELLLRESVGILGPLQRKFLLRVKANTERMGALLDDLLRITTLETGGMELAPQKVDVFYALEEVITSVTQRFGDKGVTLRMAFPQELPPLVADRSALLDILNHLLVNATLASPVKGDVELLVEMRDGTVPGDNGADIDTDCLYIAVTDSGEGISPEDRDNVFDRDYRADTPLIAGLGETGIGLSLAKALVEAHQGRIWLESEEELGTTFHVLLPFDGVRGNE